LVENFVLPKRWPIPPLRASSMATVMTLWFTIALHQLGQSNWGVAALPEEMLPPRLMTAQWIFFSAAAAPEGVLGF
jgi:hypothetical protein